LSLQHGLFINVHLVTGKSSPVVAAGLVNTVDSINNPMVKFNLIVPITGQNIDAKLKCSIQLICDFHELQTFSQMVRINIVFIIITYMYNMHYTYMAICIMCNVFMYYVMKHRYLKC